MSSPPKSVDRGRFQIYDAIGAGGVATVFRAYDRTKNEMCALKLLNVESVDNARRRRRFLAEAETLQALVHPNIVPVRGVGEKNGRLWIAMELMGGGSAARCLKQGGAMPAAQALDVIHKVLLALDAAHARDIIHRDVKPQNVLLGEDGAVKLCDFGIARLNKVPEAEVADEDGAHTQMFERLGSIIYMAPEQRADARDVSPATDVYAAGATLYALLTGRRPPDLSLAPIRAKMLEPVAPPLRPLLLKATALDRADRYAGALAMAEDVARLAADARENPTWYAPPERARRAKGGDEYAQWPTRPEPGAATGPETPELPALVPPEAADALEEVPAATATRAPAPRPMFRPSPAQPTIDPSSLGAGVPDQTPSKVNRRARSPQRTRPSVATPTSVPAWLWVGLGAALMIGAVGFALGLGLLVLYVVAA